MKKIIIVNNNMKVGGVQKSLYNLLWTIHGQYDITLCLFRAEEGEYVRELPRSVKIVESGGPFRYLGISQGECTGPDKLKRGVLAALCRVFGRDRVLKGMLLPQKPLPGHYDCAISFLHNGRREAFYGGAQEFVLERVNADKKAAFLHGDYSQCGANYPGNNRTLGRFDVIAACSDGCARVFRDACPALGDKCVTVRNCHRVDEIRGLADQEPVRYDPERRNVVMVCRLSHEKGVERAIRAAARCLEKEIPMTLHIVGGGVMAGQLAELAASLGIREQVCFYGEQSNPYRYMKNADLFLLSSYHEAAPMVLDEARCLGLPALTVQTTSSQEMVTAHGSGWVCENSQQALEEALERLLSDPEALRRKRRELRERPMNNDEAIAQFAGLTEE